MKKKVFFIGALVVLLLASAALFASKQLFIPKKVHFHAGFVVFQNNKKLDFSDYKYMNEKPCTLDKNQKDASENITLEKAHLHDNVGDIVHIERDGGVWKDLFTNIHFPIDYTITTGYINSKKVDDYQLQKIHSYDSLVVFIGYNDQKLLREAVTKEYIMKQEKKKGSCSD